jgi:hypothetical protein
MADHSDAQKAHLASGERDLGMGANITRRDFLNAVALGTGAALLGMPAQVLEMLGGMAKGWQERAAFMPDAHVPAGSCRKKGGPFALARVMSANRRTRTAFAIKAYAATACSRWG